MYRIAFELAFILFLKIRFASQLITHYTSWNCTQTILKFVVRVCACANVTFNSRLLATRFNLYAFRHYYAQWAGKGYRQTVLFSSFSGKSVGAAVGKCTRIHSLPRRWGRRWKRVSCIVSLLANLPSILTTKPLFDGIWAYSIVTQTDLGINWRSFFQ